MKFAIGRLFLLHLSIVLPRLVDAASVNISLPSDVPSTIIGADFLGFAFEEASFVGFALDSLGNTNEFSTNLISSITSRTGGKPIIRLGGTSADYATYVPDQTTPALPVAEYNNSYDVGGTTIGPGYWALTSHFPDASYIVQVPLATTNISETIEWVQSAVSIISSDQIHSFELGNEPDWYSATYQGSHRVLGPPSWQGKFTNETYVGNWTSYVAAIIASVSGLPSAPIFEAFDVAAHATADSAILGYEMDYATCFGLGIDTDNNTIKTAASHYYQSLAGTADDLAAGLMDMAWTHARMDHYSVRIDWLRANRPDIPFVLSEVGNSLNPADLFYAPEYQARLGSALWQVDFYLYAMALGVARIHYQQIMQETYNMWLPVDSGGASAHVYANYYSQPFLADFIGSSGATTMTQLDITPAVSNLAAYAAFESGSLQRIAVVNLDYWNLTSSGTTRPTVSIGLTVPSGVTGATVAHLGSRYGAGGNSATITYGGSQWTYKSLGTEVAGVGNDTDTLAVVDGIVNITVNSSEAVLVSLLFGSADL